MKPKFVVQKTCALCFLLLLLSSLTGCILTPSSVVNPTTTTAPQLSIVSMPDGSTIILNGAAQFGSSKLANLDPNLNYQGWLASGEVLVVSQLPAGTWFTIVNPNGYVAQVTANATTPGAIMLISFDPASGTFTISCILGICNLGPNNQNLSNVPLNNQGSLNQSGIFQGVSASNGTYISGVYGSFIQGGSTVPTYTSIPSATNTVTATTVPSSTKTSIPTQRPTATSTPGPNLAATATAACAQFNVQFPGTPCP
jgi:hypothetical protein